MSEKFKCNACQWEGGRDQLQPIHDVWSRLQPGDVLWDGDCPQCGAACHDVERLAKQTPATSYDEALETIIEAADAHREDIESGVEDGTYENTPENKKTVEDIERAIISLRHRGPPRVVIEVEGGCLSGVFSSQPVSFLLVDWDNIKEGDDAPNVNAPEQYTEAHGDLSAIAADIDAYVVKKYADHDDRSNEERATDADADADAYSLARGQQWTDEQRKKLEGQGHAATEINKID